jgi:hypothetical protein
VEDEAGKDLPIVKKFRHVLIRTTYDNFEELNELAGNEIQSLKPGERIKISAGEDSKFLNGWFDPEFWGETQVRAVTEDGGTILVIVDSVTSLTLHARLFAYQPVAEGGMTLSTTFNDELLTRKGASDLYGTNIWFVPSSQVREGFNIIKITPSLSKAPIDVDPESRDSRPLSFWLEWLEVEASEIGKVKNEKLYFKSQMYK